MAVLAFATDNSTPSAACFSSRALELYSSSNTPVVVVLDTGASQKQPIRLADIDDDVDEHGEGEREVSYCDDDSNK